MKLMPIAAGFLAAAVIVLTSSARPAHALDREELVSIVAIEAGVSDIEARRAVAVMFELIIETVASGELVTIDGFGTFRRMQDITRKVPQFIPDSVFRNAVR